MNPRRRRHNRLARKKRRRGDVIWHFRSGAKFTFTGPPERAAGLGMNLFYAFDDGKGQLR